MKRITKQIVYAIFLIVTLTQCDSVTSSTDKTDLKTSEHTTPTNGLESTATSTITLISPVDNADKVSSKLKFTWNAISGTSEYTYQLSDNSTFSSVILEKTVSGTSYIPEDLQYRKRYHWRVKKAGDSTGDTWSEIRSFTTGTKANDTEPVADNPEPEDTPTVVLLSPSDNADKVSSKLKFTWNAKAGTSEYTYQLSDNSTFSSVILEKTVSGTSYIPEDLQYRKKYHWRVKDAGDTTGDTWSEVRTFTTGTEANDTEPVPDSTEPETDDPEPENTPAVILLSPSNNADKVSTNLDFTWNAKSGTSDYTYQLSDNSTFSSVILEETVSGTSYSPVGLLKQKRYHWRVKDAWDNSGDTWSEIRTFTTGSETDGTIPDETEPVSPPPSSGSFVQVHNSNFVVDGNAMHFAGTNAYYLPNYEKLNPAVVDRALNLFQDTGITVVRMWGFYDGFDCGYSKNDSSENVIQTSPGVYSESALRDLDNVIAKGKERGIGFIIPFINFWDELGGVCQYNTWAGASNPSTNMAFFLSNSDTQKWYKDYINMLLNRVNTVTGIAYKDEPAIVAWQIMNEGRNRGASPTILRDWYREIAQYIKSIDPNHLVSTGEEGFDEGTPSVYSLGEYTNTYTLRAGEGTSYVLNTAIPEIDFGSAHWYPSEYGFGSTMNNDLLRAQRAWLSDHNNIAASYGKPFIIGEFGLPGWGDERVSTMYNALYDHAESIKLGGNLLWQLVADGTKCWEFGGNICYPDGRADSALYSDFKSHVNVLRNLK